MSVEEQTLAARRDLDRLNFPPASWVPAKAGPDGRALERELEPTRWYVPAATREIRSALDPRGN